MLISQRNKKRITSIGLIFLVSAAVFVFTPQISQAAAWYNLPGRAVDYVMSWTLKFVLSGFGIFLALTAQIFEWTLNITHFASAPAVKIAWAITRDLANLSFILILITIAFAAILRVETYGMKSLLPKLIVVALLVNFSLVMCGAVIDASQVITGFFMDQAKEGGDLTLKIVDGLSLQKTLQLAKGGWQKLEAAANIPGNFVISLIGGIIVIIGATLAFFLGALFLITRIIALWILIILSPLALLAAVLPATKGLWSKWVQSFIKWTLFAPIYTFFVYLAALTIQKGGITEQISSSSVSFSENLSMPAFMNSFLKFDTILTYLMILGFLIGGLMIAQKAGAWGAEGTMKFAKGLGEKPGNWARSLGNRALMKMAPAPEKIKDATGKVIGEKGGLIQRGLSKLAKVPVAGKLARPAFGALEKARSRVEERQKLMDNWTSPHIISTYNRMNSEDKVGAMLQLLKNGDLNDLPDKQRKEGLKLAKRYGKESKLVKAMPALSQEVGKTIPETIEKTSAEDAKNIIESQLDDKKTPEAKEVIDAIKGALKKGKWTTSHLTKIGNESAVLREMIQKYVLTQEFINLELPANHPLRNYLDGFLGSTLYEAPKDWLGSGKPQEAAELKAAEPRLRERRIIPGSKYGPVK
ncbi:MAG: hypothetical protein AUJ11_01305 [Parcubacteria group bacterium CG1_02_44_65]|uniref:Uncharacterized protein n=1 Tax=Candidatus Portnoybacteria bacterium CG_4_10_14_0_2_um_filter_43_36 TaxID=1974798 RepID=A0A2M7UD07_9BACT|nr:MAG: hypothetical protein AUJ11_01305 [Parcubacteria group bacterium CG1_02_44_65]PIZ69136.1 MAG: hypothetical protein COY10_02050 [Candidatus Portnoybacteria bacterium CG_4_10_14_0_2_um_filter_43_36]